MQRGRFVMCGSFGKVASRNGVFTVWIWQIFQNKLHIKKKEMLFHKIFLVDERLKRETRLEPGQPFMQ